MAQEVPTVCYEAQAYNALPDRDSTRLINMWTDCLDGELSTELRSNIHFNRGNQRREVGDMRGAILDYTRAITLNPGYAVAYYNRGNVYATLGEIRDAIKDYDEAIAADPQMARAYANRAWLYMELARRDAAKALELNPKTKVPDLE